jgi:hypothetical protein
MFLQRGSEEVWNFVSRSSRLAGRSCFLLCHAHCGRPYSDTTSIDARSVRTSSLIDRDATAGARSSPSRTTESIGTARWHVLLLGAQLACPALWCRLVFPLVVPLSSAAVCAVHLLLLRLRERANATHSAEAAAASEARWTPGQTDRQGNQEKTLEERRGSCSSTPGPPSAVRRCTPLPVCLRARSAG